MLSRVALVGVAALAVATAAVAAPTNIVISRDVQVTETLTAASVGANALEVNGTMMAKDITASGRIEAASLRADALESNVLSPKVGDTIIVQGDLELAGAAAPKASGAAPAQFSFLAQDVVLDGVRQWRLVHSDNFDAAPEKEALAWSKGAYSTSTCGSTDRFLGGHCVLGGDGRVTKRFERLGKHTQVRLKATVHFIDSWTGEQAFAKMGTDLVWVDTIGSAEAVHSPAALADLDVCGKKGEPELALGKLVDVTKYHDSDAIEITFGTTLPGDSNPCDKSWGIDDIQLWVR